MKNERFKLRIKAHRLGTIKQVTEMLLALDDAYNNLFLFDLIVDSVIKKGDVESITEELYYRGRKKWKETYYESHQRIDPYLFLITHNPQPTLGVA